MLTNNPIDHPKHATNLSADHLNLKVINKTKDLHNAHDISQSTKPIPSQIDKSSYAYKALRM